METFKHLLGFCNDHPNILIVITITFLIIKYEQNRRTSNKKD